MSKAGILGESWGTIESSAQDTLVRLYMDGGNPPANAWIDTFVAEKVKEQYGITLVRVPLPADVVVERLIADKGSENGKGGVDLFWGAGRSFRTAREQGVLYGPFAEKLPNYVKYVDKRMAAMDFGSPVDGYQVPFGRMQFVLEYDSSRVANPPQSFIDLLRWVAEHPGRFTYPAPPDPTGSAFVRQLFYAVTGSPKQFEPGWNEKRYRDTAPRVWEYLKEMKPYLWRAGIEYPKSGAELDTLFAKGEIDIAMSYSPFHADSKVRSKEFGAQTRTYLLELGTLYSMHSLAIPDTASNKAGAMVVANFLLSPEAQLSKYRPEVWGDCPALDLNTLSKDAWNGFAAVQLGPAVLPVSELTGKGFPEIAPEYAEALERDWAEHIK